MDLGQSEFGGGRFCWNSGDGTGTDLNGARVMIDAILLTEEREDAKASTCLESFSRPGDIL